MTNKITGAPVPKNLPKVPTTPQITSQKKKPPNSIGGYSIEGASMFNIIKEPIRFIFRIFQLSKKDTPNKDIIIIRVIKAPFSAIQAIGNTILKIDTTLGLTRQFEKIIGISSGIVAFSKAFTKPVSKVTTGLATGLYIIEYIISLLRIKKLVDFSSTIKNIKTLLPNDLINNEQSRKYYIRYIKNAKQILTKRWGEKKYDDNLKLLESHIKEKVLEGAIERKTNTIKNSVLLASFENFEKKYLPKSKNSEKYNLKRLNGLIRNFAAKEVSEKLKDIIPKIKKLNKKITDIDKKLSNRNLDLSIRHSLIGERNRYECQIQEKIQQTKELINLMDTQYKKAMVINIISIVAVSTMIVSLVASFILLFSSAPYLIILIPEIIYFTGFSLEFLKNIYAAGIMDRKGWGFDVRAGIWEYLYLGAIWRNILKPLGKQLKSFSNTWYKAKRRGIYYGKVYPFTPKEKKREEEEKEKNVG